MKNFKKLICTILCITLTLISAVSVSATTDDSQYYVFFGTDTIPANTLRVTKFGTGIEPTSKVTLTDISDESIVHTFNVPENNIPINTVLSSETRYDLFSYFSTCGSNYNSSVKVNNKPVKYEKIRFKLSDFSSYFNDDGTVTKELFGDVHNYNFTKESDGHISSLIFISGGCITFAAPDKYGCVEIYASTEVGAEIRYKTGFAYKHSSGGGTTGHSIDDFTIGDVNSNGFVSVIDATDLQKSLVGNETLSDDFLSKRRCDVNKDGEINVIDSTEIQKYIVGL